MVQEGLCVFMPCTVIYRQYYWTDCDPAHDYWFREKANAFKDAPVATNSPHCKVQEKMQGRFCLLGDLWTDNGS